MVQIFHVHGRYEGACKLKKTARQYSAKYSVQPCHPFACLDDIESTQAIKALFEQLNKSLTRLSPHTERYDHAGPRLAAVLWELTGPVDIRKTNHAWP